MNDRDDKPSREELVKQLPTPGWNLETGDRASAMKDRTLEELVRASHARHTNGDPPGLIKRIENAIELDLLQLQELWAHLGLPM